ncbi:HlyD family type I secretion periplasmic adaptor subunit [Rhizobium pusense]|jgi:HlyD family secretion protein|uniref:Membrane fusion protein (MFP) family protein n=2 Tax=Agrobacterium TaxID=357 RepID=A0A1L9CU02_9HYPH|nr:MULTISPECIES: HlyD family type I secretion periplasmic adaptor subunit [Rhizobium/Agrobacterium group]ANV27148.1 hemolysin secretion protein D [Rhizobium sp. S41]MBW9068874.1 HlyD family type I secretion periplasmic adaptor subunit [Agrobacterium pusense]MBW9084176.1 HlyD family type I secretion periplasmic adaptor subunit [Agrobacterium pusense]MBW9123494.1 HlyD family type I secretion periplasmic adaptor subunit [Agrobacterium pusense]MBW9136081.1 HlyD family type I secretion periplasmic 
MDEWQTLRRSIRNHIFVGGLGFLTLVGVFGGWAVGTEIVGAVIAQGSLVVETSLKKVQHPVGGVVSELAVRDGDRVKAGDVVMRIDATMTKANLAIIVKSLDQFTARKARLESERDRAGRVIFPQTLLDRAGDGEVLAMMNAEQRLYENRKAVRESKKRQLEQRVRQLRDEISGMEAERAANFREQGMVDEELIRFRSLHERGLMEKSRLSTLERQATDIDGDIGRLMAGIAGVEAKISETALQILQIDEQWSEEVGSDLREMDARIGEYVERRVAAEDQLKRVDILAPQDGVVHQLSVHTIGGVVAPGEQIMMIVPEVDKLVVEVKVAPQDIDQIYYGQLTNLRFSAFNQKTTPEITGTVERISADVTVDQRTGTSFYLVRVATSQEQIKRLGEFSLMPGMPVEAFITTGERSVLSYFLKPLIDQANRTFREA